MNWQPIATRTLRQPTDEHPAVYRAVCVLKHLWTRARLSAQRVPLASCTGNLRVTVNGSASEKGVRLAPKMRVLLAHAFLWEYSDKRLKLAQLLGQLGIFLTNDSTARGPKHPAALRQPASPLA
jgi:hypothetical protein